MSRIIKTVIKFESDFILTDIFYSMRMFEFSLAIVFLSYLPGIDRG